MGTFTTAGRPCSGAQGGSVLLVVLLIMIAISVLGVMGLQSSAVEMDLVRNGRDIRETFYLSEGAALEGVQLLVNAAREDLQDAQPVWHHARKAVQARGWNFRGIDDWDGDGQGGDDNSVQSRLSRDSLICAVEWDVACGGSLVMTESRLVVTRVYGLSKKHDADQVIEIGYAMRY